MGCGMSHWSGVGSAQRNAVEDDDWLGGRDSNPDNHVQSVVSYR